MRELQVRLYQELYRKSFYDFVRDFWQTADPSKMVDGKLIKYYCEVFQYACRNWIDYKPVHIKLPKQTPENEIIDIRQGKNNYCINMPPRHSKSMIFNVLGPVWLWTYYPIKAVSISHTAGLAGVMNRKRYAVINSDRYKAIFGNKISLTINSATALKDDRGGELYSLNKNAMTGYGGDVIINDDLTNAESARKDQQEMASTWAYYQNTMPSRINDPKKCIIFNIQQRLAPNDITGHIMSDSKLAGTYVFIVLPAQFEKTTYLVCPISGDIITYRKGEYLWSERFGNYESIKNQVGESIYQTQYLQKPVASDKTVIKENMIISVEKPEAPEMENADMIYASHDFPVKDKETSDFLGSVLAYRNNETIYIADCLEKRMAYTKSVEYVKQINDVYPGSIQVIEDKANGSPILQQLQDEVPGLQAYQPGTASKYQRLESASLYMLSRNVVFVKTQWNKLTSQYEFTEGMQNLINRLLSFPFVEHDDITDAFSMLILYVFMDRRYMVYGRSFGDKNIISAIPEKVKYSEVFFVKEGEIWKAAEIGVQYGTEQKIFVMRETVFKADIKEGFSKLSDFKPGKKVFIDASPTDALKGLFPKGISVVRNCPDNFDESVERLNLAFAKGVVLVHSDCKSVKSDISTFKFSKSKDNTVKYASEKDGFGACLRAAVYHFGINI